jgi:hypothetical protein
MVARSSSDAPAAAASRRIRSVSSRISAGSLRVQSAIVKARESVMSPAASAVPSSGRPPSWCFWRTEALAAFFDMPALAASQADDEP